MLRNRMYYAAGLAAAVILFSFDMTWTGEFMLFLALALPVLSLLLSIIPAKRVKYALSSPLEVKRGEDFQILITDLSGRRVPCYYINMEIIDPCGGGAFWTAEMTGGERRTVPLRVEHCCAVSCRVASAFVCDYLGLFRFRLPAAADAVTFIMPEPVAPDPAPDLTAFSRTSFHPKYGGGFSEIHELRDYRAGDSLRDIHWKLSAKTDKLIVREPQEEDRGKIVITVDIQPPSRETDSILDQLAWLSGRLLERGVAHEVRYIESATLETVSVPVGDGASEAKMLRQVLSECSAEKIPAGQLGSITGADWHWHISGKAGDGR